MPQSVGYGEAEILRVGIRPVEALHTERLPPAPELRSSLRPSFRTGLGRVTRASPVQTTVRNCTRDEGRPFGFGNQVLISSHRKLLRLNVVVVSVAETPGR